MVTPGFYENTICLSLSAMMNENDHSFRDEQQAAEAKVAQAGGEAFANAATSLASAITSGEVASAVAKAAAKAVAEAALQIAAAAAGHEQQAAEHEQQAAEGEVALPTKKQRINDEQWFTKELEQAKSRIQELQEELAQMQEYKNDLVTMLNEMGVDNKRIAERLSNMGPWKSNAVGHA